MSGLNLTDFLSLVKSRKFILNSHIDNIPVMNYLTSLDPMCLLYVPSAKNRLGLFHIYFMDAPIPLTFGLKYLY